MRRPNLVAEVPKPGKLFGQDVIKLISLRFFESAGVGNDDVALPATAVTLAPKTNLRRCIAHLLNLKFLKINDR